MNNPAVFFDRDDTIIKNVPYLGDPGKVELMPDVIQALQRLQECGLELFIISNQSGVGRGFITKGQVAEVNAEMIRQLGKNFFRHIYICYDDPKNPIEGCRKPSPIMIHRAQQENHLNPHLCFFVGDKLIDMQAGKNAGCTSILYTLNGQEGEISKARELADFASADLLEIAEWICRNTKYLRKNTDS
jgi:D-glycero-D-manno-heptose 1,7-bisphosphate phosphatase